MFILTFASMTLLSTPVESLKDYTLVCTPLYMKMRATKGELETGSLKEKTKALRINLKTLFNSKPKTRPEDAHPIREMEMTQTFVNDDFHYLVMDKDGEQLHTAKPDGFAGSLITNIVLHEDENGLSPIRIDVEYVGEKNKLTHLDADLQLPTANTDENGKFSSNWTFATMLDFRADSPAFSAGCYFEKSED